MSNETLLGWVMLVLVGFGMVILYAWVAWEWRETRRRSRRGYGASRRRLGASVVARRRGRESADILTATEQRWT
jgi:hypothetical protein